MKLSKRAGSDEKRLLNWVERVATFCTEQYGLPPITGRILGWLMICDPAEQSGAEIAEAIRASRASITTNMQMLTAGGLARRSTRPGSRTVYYVIDDDAWDKVMQRRIQSLLSFQQITVDALELIGTKGSQATRIRRAHECFGKLAKALNESLKAK